LAFEIGAEAVVEPPGEPGWLAERVRRAGDALPSGRVVGVLGSRGGAGASVFAASLAMAAVRAGHTPYLVDLDPLGCGLGVVLGQDTSSGLTWGSVSAGVGRIPALSLQSAVSQVHGISLLGWGDEEPADLASGVAGAVVDAARLCTPVTVLDLGRAATPAQREALARCDRALLVVPADVRSVRAASRMTQRLSLSMCELVVRGPNPGGLVAEDVGEAVGLPVLAAVGAERDLDRRLERGEPPGGRARSPLGRAGAGILKDVLR
jgi:secretion/DNA translocation related CpaE-like protein